MNTPEMIYETIQFLFSDLWVYLGLLLLILTIRGDISKSIKATSDFFKRAAMNFRKLTMTEDNFEKYKRDREYKVKQ